MKILLKRHAKKSVVRSFHLSDEIIRPNILSQTGSILGGIISENEQFRGFVTHDIIFFARPPSKMKAQKCLSPLKHQPKKIVTKCVVRSSRLSDEIIRPHILPQTGSILGDIMSENKHVMGSVTHDI